MKSVDRPPANPKRITIESSQEFFSVEIPRSASTGDPPNTKHSVHRPADHLLFMKPLTKLDLVMTTMIL